MRQVRWASWTVGLAMALAVGGVRPVAADVTSDRAAAILEWPSVVYAEDKTPDGWVVDPASGGYVVSVMLTTPFQASAGMTYWYGASLNTQSLGQFSVLTPGDGAMAQFFGSLFLFHADVGDQMFQLIGVIVPVELQSIVVE